MTRNATVAVRVIWASRGVRRRCAAPASSSVRSDWPAVALGVVSAIRTDSRGADRDQEGGGVEYGQIAAAEAGIEGCPGKRRGNAQALADGSHGDIGASQVRVGDEVFNKSRSGWSDDGECSAVADGHRVHHPQLCPRVNRQKAEHGSADCCVGGDEQRTSPDSVDKLTGKGRCKAGQTQRGEDGAGCRVAAGEVLGPDAQRQVQRAVTEAGDRVADQKPPEAGIPPPPPSAPPGPARGGGPRPSTTGGPRGPGAPSGGQGGGLER